MTNLVLREVYETAEQCENQHGVDSTIEVGNYSLDEFDASYK